VKKPKPRTYIFLGAYAVFLVVSVAVGFDTGVAVAENLVTFTRGMVLVLPLAMILIGLFEVWVPRAIIERHLGQDAGALAYFWSFLLAGTTVGGLYVAFPVAWALRHKGARLGVVFAYVGLAGVCRVPMTLFEMSFMGVEFTLIRYGVGVPLVILFSHFLGSALDRRDFEMASPDHPEP
jgi:uncharacterized membrane protein YraQ (UPF0718 family)